MLSQQCKIKVFKMVSKCNIIILPHRPGGSLLAHHIMQAAEAGVPGFSMPILYSVHFIKV